MSLIGCCCGPPNSCNCTWPATETYDGPAPLQSGAFIPTTAVGPPFTLAWGPPPMGAGVDVNNDSIGAGALFYNFPADSWWSAPFPGDLAGTPVDMYIYMGITSCSSTLMTVWTQTGGGAGWACNALGSVVFAKTTCTPFVLTGTVSGTSHTVTGAHGGDDLTPVGGSLGFFTHHN